MAVNALPLLHKYVLSPEDDKDLTLAKLKYRLCVKEVCEVLISRAQEKGFEPSSQQATTTVDDDSSFHVNPTLKWEDSGIGTDESVSEDLRSPQHNDNNIFRITEEPSINDISRQPHSISDEAFHPPASSFLSSPSTSSSDSCEESEETETPSFLFSRKGENFDNGENNGEREFFENVYTDAKDSVAPIHISSCFGNQVEEHLHEEEEEEMEEEEEEAFVPVMSSTLESRMDESTDDISPMEKTHHDVLTNQGQGDDRNISPRGTNDRCTDVDEALRILLTHKELPQINSRKAVSTWSWNAADIARGPQKVSLQMEGNTEQQESQAKRNSSNQLRATHEKILIKDKKLADIYRKIKERDDEDQRMVKELLKKQTIPFAEPLPVALPPKPAPPPPETIRPPQPIETIRPAPVEKAVIADAKPKEDSSASSSSARKTLTRAEEPARKRKNGNVFQNVVHSLQRRFSTKRNRESTAAAS